MRTVVALSVGLMLLGVHAAPRFVREVPWAGKGKWIAVDTHIHTKFSDGTSTVSEVAAKAAQYGCQAIAITDHGDSNLKAATPEYAQAIRAARSENPQMPILAGLEWNVPPWKGDEHASILAPPGSNEFDTLAEFKKRFDDYHRTDHDSLDSVDALRWLASHGAENGLDPVVVYNHPSRKVDTSTENVADIARWRAVNDLVIGFEGAPGHQAKSSPGDYVYKERTVDRWDPAVARLGDAWDSLLQKEIVFGGAIATSDFHDGGPGNDYWPCQFSETWLYAPEISAAGVLRAMRAGALFGVHGHIIRNVSLTVESDGLDRSATMGEAIAVPVGSSLIASIRLDVPPVDWEGRSNQIERLEIIAIGKSSVRVIASTNAPTASLRGVVTVPDGGLVIRARGIRISSNGPALGFYTNPIWIAASR